MPAHDWTRVESGIFHDFHHAWIEQIKRSLNESLLPPEYYAMAEQHIGGFGPDVVTLQLPLEYTSDESDGADVTGGAMIAGSDGGLLLLTPSTRLTEEAELDFYHRKQNVVAVRHVSGDRVVAVVEVVSPGNKASQYAFRSLLDKAGDLLDRGIHLLILDLFPPGPRNPRGIHSALWEDFTGRVSTPVEGKPLTLVSYESDLAIRAYVEPIAVGDALPPMPLFLRPRGHVLVPLEESYQAAWNAVPRRWQNVVAG